MFKRKKKDPIAEKLRKAFPSDGPAPTPDSITLEQAYFWDTLQGRHAKWSAQQPEASYETIDFVESDDEKVMNFLSDLGFNPESIEKATIVCEVGKPLQIEVKGYAVDKVSHGSTYKSWDPEA